MAYSEEDKAATKAAGRKLAKQTGLDIGSAYGFGHDDGTEAKWFLIVWSDDENVQFPETFEGYPVVKRGVPVAYSL